MFGEVFDHLLVTFYDDVDGQLEMVAGSPPVRPFGPLVGSTGLLATSFRKASIMSDCLQQVPLAPLLGPAGSTGSL